ncbi:MAG: hypothetical protein K9H25_09725 [Rhodospirillum sp.]|nr:hypothetical protein [Rhodospirillum sp.]MCF8491681.1 hypothetical protein [Rhodospirillum sp.]MCF8501070.1 hypothetical protein [Rhodospirillum sp.]
MKVHALKLSIAANILLMGMLIGLSIVVLTRRSGPPFGPPPPVLMVDSFMRDLITKTLPKEKQADALVALNRRAAELSERIGKSGMDKGPESPRDGPLAKAFLAGAMDQAFVDGWVVQHEADQQARTQFLGEVFLDLSGILNAEERESFIDALDRTLEEGRSGGPPPPTGKK